MNDKDYEIRKIEIENVIWFIYIAIIVLALLSNYYEKNGIVNNDEADKTKSRNINVFNFTILVLIYIYFLSVSYNEYKKSPNNMNYLGLLANISNVVGGFLFLYVAIKSGLVEPVIDL